MRIRRAPVLGACLALFASNPPARATEPYMTTNFDAFVSSLPGVGGGAVGVVVCSASVQTDSSQTPPTQVPLYVAATCTVNGVSKSVLVPGPRASIVMNVFSELRVVDACMSANSVIMDAGPAGQLLPLEAVPRCDRWTV